MNLVDFPVFHDDGDKVFIAMQCPFKMCTHKFQVIWAYKSKLVSYSKMNYYLMLMIKKHCAKEHR